jgi:hypothetical protein
MLQLYTVPITQCTTEVYTVCQRIDLHCNVRKMASVISTAVTIVGVTVRAHYLRLGNTPGAGLVAGGFFC